MGYSLKITDTTRLIERMKRECAKVDTNLELLHRVHVNQSASTFISEMMEILFVYIPT